MPTTYDEIFTEFISITKTDKFNIPQTNEGKYDMIHSAIKHFNNRMRFNLQYNDTTETVDKELSIDEILIIAHYMRLAFLENDLIYNTTLLMPFEKEIGVKNLANQLSAKRELVNNEKKEIDNLILNQTEDYL